MEKEKIMSIVENATTFVMGMLCGVTGWCIAMVALGKIDEDDPSGWAIFALLVSFFSMVLI